MILDVEHAFGPLKVFTDGKNNFVLFNAFYLLGEKFAEMQAEYGQRLQTGNESIYSMLTDLNEKHTFFQKAQDRIGEDFKKQATVIKIALVIVTIIAVILASALALVLLL
jgi:hypothetical protein